MRIPTIFVAAVIAAVAAGCAQQPLPRPYPSSDRDPAEPTVSTGSSARITQGENTQGAGPQPIAAPEIGAADTGLTVQPDRSEMLSDEIINERISSYEDKLRQWQLLDQQSGVTSLDAQQARLMVDCYRDLQRLLSGYQGLQERYYQSSGSGVLIDNSSIFTLLKQDIDFTEGTCRALLDKSGPGPAGADPVDGSGSTAEIEALVGKLYKEGAYERVIGAWMQIPTYQKERVSDATLMMFGDAYARLGQPAEAAEVYQQIVEQMSGPVLQENNLLSIRRRLADLYVAAGNFFGAEGQYEQLTRDYQEIGRIDEWARLQLSMLERSMKGSPELTDYSELLRDYLSYTVEIDGYSVVWRAETFLQNYPYSPVSTNVEIIKEETLSAADQWFSAKLEEADRLAGDGQTQEALNLLQMLPQDKLSPDKLVLVKDKTDALVLADAVDRESEKIVQLQALQSVWNEASAQVDSGDVDGAIRSLNQLFGTEFDQRARERVDELALTAATSERRRAADIFVRSTKAGDIDSQKTLLAESWQVLNDILLKYPEVEIADRVKGNIVTVEKRINDVDPMFLDELKARQSLREESLPEPEFEVDGFDVESPNQTMPGSQKAPAPLPVYTPQSLQMQ